MFDFIMYVGLAGMVISMLMIFVIPRRTLTNGIDMPIVARIGLFLFVISIFTTLAGAFFSSDIGMLILG